MTGMQGWITEELARKADTARPGTCPLCQAPVLRARAGRVAALDVTADPTPIDVTAEILARINGQLTWHLVTNTLGHSRITWRDIFHIRSGPAKHPVIADHRCPPHPVQETLL
ncbi:hypothetical protein [Streptomyces sp. 1222.5]|uniref:hypothetical protein n=1 Tax=Streptomyces sp. 1222.5 TaxID=1881026 RepID=UPI003EBC6121